MDDDRKIVLAQLPRHLRPAFAALWNLDLAFADIVSTTSDAHIGAIRMAWWRERLEELDEGAVPAEPRLLRVRDELISRQFSGCELSKLEDAWLPLLASFPWREEVADGLKRRGQILFGVGARILGGDAEDGEAAGALWSLVDGARHCSDVHSRMFLLERARSAIQELPPNRPPKFLRRLTGLAAIAAHDAIRNRPLDLASFSPGRGMAAVAHYLRGTFPRG